MTSREYEKRQNKKRQKNTDIPDSWTIDEKEIDCELFKKDKNNCLKCEEKYNITWCMGM